jgi:VanZ family protein
MLRSALRRTALGGYVAAMLAALLLPVPDTPSYVPGAFDKLAHVGLFLGFALLAAWNARGSRGLRTVTAFGAGALLAALVEVVQSPLPYRSGDVVDLAAGVVGALLGATLGARTGPPGD